MSEIKVKLLFKILCYFLRKIVKCKTEEWFYVPLAVLRKTYFRCTGTLENSWNVYVSQQTIQISMLVPKENTTKCFVVFRTRPQSALWRDE